MREAPCSCCTGKQCQLPCSPAATSSLSPMTSLIREANWQLLLVYSSANLIKTGVWSWVWPHCDFVFEAVIEKRVSGWFNNLQCLKKNKNVCCCLTRKLDRHQATVASKPSPVVVLCVQNVTHDARLCLSSQIKFAAKTHLHSMKCLFSLWRWYFLVELGEWVSESPQNPTLPVRVVWSALSGK